MVPKKVPSWNAETIPSCPTLPRNSQQICISVGLGFALAVQTLRSATSSFASTPPSGGHSAFKHFSSHSVTFRPFFLLSTSITLIRAIIIILESTMTSYWQDTVLSPVSSSPTVPHSSDDRSRAANECIPFSAKGAHEFATIYKRL